MLTRNPVHSSADFETTLAFLRNKGLDGRIAARDTDARQQFRSAINAVYGTGFYLAYMQYGVDVEIDAPADRADYSFSIPYRGEMASSTPQGPMACTDQQTVITSPGQPQTMFLSGGTQRLSMSIDAGLLRRRFALLTGEQVRGDIVFDPKMRVANGPGQLILSNIELVIDAYDRGGDVFANPCRETQFEETVLTALLVYQPHSHGWLLDRPAPAPASRDVKRVIDFLHENLETTLSLDDLVSIAGVPGRTLNEHFRAFTGLAPMAYARRERLRAVRRLLLSGEMQSVTEAAMRFGFSHLGRFAALYREGFGETPSETVRRARLRSHGQSTVV